MPIGQYIYLIWLFPRITISTGSWKAYHSISKNDNIIGLLTALQNKAMLTWSKNKSSFIWEKETKIDHK